MAGLESFDPATGARLGVVPRTPPGGVQAAADEARRVQPFWAALPLADRARYLRRTARVVVSDLDALTDLLAREQGRPRTEAMLMEILASVDALRWMAREGPAALGDQRLRTRQAPLRGKRSRVTHEPLGVVGVAAPWPSPWASGLRRVALALMAGNGVVLHAADLAPVVSSRIATALGRAGVPAGLVQVVAGAVADAELDASGLDRVVRVEGGGRDPMLVLADATASHAAGGAVWAAFSNAGQSRGNVGRAIVRREVAGRFVEAVVERANRLRVGDPRRWDTDVGPLAGPDQLERVMAVVDEAVAEGARRHCGGPVRVPGLAGSFLAPVVLTGVTPDMRVVGEEVPGPVLPIISVAGDEEAIAVAAAGAPSVGASVWTGDRDRGAQIARALRAERTWINDHMLNALSPAGFDEVAAARLRVSGPTRPSRLRDLWWYPYDDSLAGTARAAARYLYGREEDRLRALREGRRPALRLARRLARDAVRG